MNSSPGTPESSEVTLATAQQQFVTIMGNLAAEDKPQMIRWIKQNWINGAGDSMVPLDDSGYQLLKTIAAEIRDHLPPEAILPSENIRNFDTTDPHHSIHIDSFLYDDDEVDDLCEMGKVDRNFCLNCGSHKTQPLGFISHSLSREQIIYIFTGLLPPLTSSQLVLDVGSRLGVVLYGAFLYTNAARIVGIELNADFCTLQKNVVKKFGFQDRVEVIEGNIFHRPDLLQAADVIVLHNVFECFMQPQMQVDMWKYLRQTIKAGTTLVSSPPLDKVFAFDQTGIVLGEWVEELAPHNREAAVNYNNCQDSAITAYRVV